MADARTVGVLVASSSGAALARPPRTRARLSRTLSRSRWREYARLLERAIGEGYTIISLEQWLRDNQQDARILILRHDVDQCPRAALRMLGIERRLGVHATWYFRWRTARPRVVRAVQAAGGEVGLHYESLSRAVLTSRAAGREVAPGELVEAARRELKRELTAWSVLFGEAQSACAHGDTRVPDVNNAVLLREVPLAEYGLRFDANASMQSRDLAVWLTDRNRAEGSWRDELDADAIVAAHASPVLLLTHPNNWVSGLGLWQDRLLAATLPEPGIGTGRALRTSSDTPPLAL